MKTKLNFENKLLLVKSQKNKHSLNFFQTKDRL